jgi:hypothetical protein
MIEMSGKQGEKTSGGKKKCLAETKAPQNLSQQNASTAATANHLSPSIITSRSSATVADGDFTGSNVTGSKKGLDGPNKVGPEPC